MHKDLFDLFFKSYSKHFVTKSDKKEALNYPIEYHDMNFFNSLDLFKLNEHSLIDFDHAHIPSILAQVKSELL